MESRPGFAGIYGEEDAWLGWENPHFKLSVFKKRVDVACGDMGQWWPCQCWGNVALGGLRGLFQPSQFHGSWGTGDVLQVFLVPSIDLKHLVRPTRAGLAQVGLCWGRRSPLPAGERRDLPPSGNREARKKITQKIMELEQVHLGTRTQDKIEVNLIPAMRVAQ